MIDRYVAADLITQQHRKQKALRVTQYRHSWCTDVHNDGCEEHRTTYKDVDNHI